MKAWVRPPGGLRGLDIGLNLTFSEYGKSKQGSKNQESIQSSTTPDPGYHWESEESVHTILRIGIIGALNEMRGDFSGPPRSTDETTLIIKVWYQIKENDACGNKVANILLADPSPPPRPRGGVKRSKATFFSEYGHVSYKIIGNDICSNMITNILPAELPHPWVRSKFNFFITWSCCISFKWNPQSSDMVANYFCLQSLTFFALSQLVDMILWWYIENFRKPPCKLNS